MATGVGGGGGGSVGAAGFWRRRMDERVGQIERLYRETGPGLLAYLRARMDPSDAEDILQETFVEAARHGGRLAGAASPGGWLFGVARNLMLARLRRARTVRMGELPADAAARPTESGDDRLASMRAAIAGLEDRLREVLTLRLAGELSYAEIAEALGIPIGTVRSRLHAAVGALREKMTND